MMKPSHPKSFLRIIATLLVLTSLQSCDVCLSLMDLGLEWLDDWSFSHQGYSEGGHTYSYSGGGRSHRPTYRPTNNKSKGHKEKIIEKEKKIKTKKEKCTVCNGTGLVEWDPEFYMIDNWCKICQSNKKSTHQHPIKCKDCNGEGVIYIPIEETKK